MRGRPSVWRRARKLEGRYRSSEFARINRIMCELEGVDPVEVEHDCRYWEARFRKTGAVTLREKEALIAAEIGVSVEEFHAEVEAIAQQTMAVWQARR